MGSLNHCRSAQQCVYVKKKDRLAVIVHEWLSLPHNERLTMNQAVLFAEKAKKRYNFRDYQLILDQINKHVGKSY
jgi:hypothetical protein